MSKPAVVEPDVAAHDAGQLDVADDAVDGVVVVDPVLLHGHGLEPEVVGHAGHLAGVVRLHAADGHERVAALGQGVGREVLELAHLVAAEGDAAVAVLALGPDLDFASQRLRESPAADGPETDRRAAVRADSRRDASGPLEACVCRVSGASGVAARTCPRPPRPGRRPSPPAAWPGCLRAPRAAIDWRSAPTRFSVPSVTREGPKRMRSMRAHGADLDAGAARQRRRGRGHAPVGAVTGRLLRACQRRADHEQVRAGGDGLGHLATTAHAAVADDRDVDAGALEVVVAGGGHVGDGGHLRYADAQHLTRGAGGTRPDAHEDGRDALLHERCRRLVRGGVAGRHGDAHEPGELGRAPAARSRRPGAGRMRPATGRGRRRPRPRRRTGPSGAPPPGVAEMTAGEPAACSSRDAAPPRSPSAMGAS